MPRRPLRAGQVDRWCASCGTPAATLWRIVDKLYCRTCWEAHQGDQDDQDDGPEPAA